MKNIVFSLMIATSIIAISLPAQAQFGPNETHVQLGSDPVIVNNGGAVTMDIGSIQGQGSGNLAGVTMDEVRSETQQGLSNNVKLGSIIADQADQNRTDLSLSSHRSFADQGGSVSSSVASIEATHAAGNRANLYNHDRSILVAANGQAVAVNKVASIQAEKALNNRVDLVSGNVNTIATGDSSIALTDLASITAGFAKDNLAGASVDGSVYSEANNGVAMTKIASIDANYATADQNRTQVEVNGSVRTYGEEGGFALTRIGSIESLSGADLLENSTDVRVHGSVLNASNGQNSSSIVNIGSIVQ